MSTVNTLIQKLHSREIDAATLFHNDATQFEIGDVVIIGPPDFEGCEEIIVTIEVIGGVIKYATDESAWHTADKMTLVSKARK